jgi:hypothetical protein
VVSQIHGVVPKDQNISTCRNIGIVRQFEQDFEPYSGMIREFKGKEKKLT